MPNPDVCRRLAVATIWGLASVALELGERGIDLGDVQGWLGHRDITTDLPPGLSQFL